MARVLVRSGSTACPRWCPYGRGRPSPRTHGFRKLITIPRRIGSCGFDVFHHRARDSADHWKLIHRLARTRATDRGSSSSASGWPTSVIVPMTTHDDIDDVRRTVQSINLPINQINFSLVTKMKPQTASRAFCRDGSSFRAADKEMEWKDARSLSRAGARYGDNVQISGLYWVGTRRWWCKTFWFWGQVLPINEHVSYRDNRRVSTSVTNCVVLRR